MNTMQSGDIRTPYVLLDPLTLTNNSTATARTYEVGDSLLGESVLPRSSLYHLCISARIHAHTYTNEDYYMISWGIYIYIYI